LGVAIGVLVVLALAAGGVWCYQLTRAAPGPSQQEVTAIVSNGNDRGPGSLREALFVVASAKEAATISIQTRRIALETALPPIVTTHGVKIVSEQPDGVEIDAAALKSNSVLDVAGANTSLEGVTIRNCSGAAILLRAERFRLSASTIEDCDVGVDVAENARSIVIENNELDGLSAYGIMVRGSGNTLVRGNRMHNCGYGMAFVLGAAGEAPSTAVQNTIIQPRFNGIDIVGDSPVLRQNQVLRPHALALHVEDFQPPNGVKVTSRPFLDNNTFGPPDTAVATGRKAPAKGVSSQ
jgi:parallel beta-helix repeat protein